ncbi:hypothetical protein VYU27_010391, partial [Nannochloropsis oceanica]
MLRREEANYFGVCSKGLYLREIRLLESGIGPLLRRMARATKKRREKANAKGEVRQQLLKGDEKEEEEEEEGGKGMGVKGRGGERGGGGGKEGGIEHPTARLFWAKHFECHDEVYWPRFVAAFEKEWGHHPQEAYDRFKKAVVRPPCPLPAPLTPPMKEEGGREDAGEGGLGEGMVSLETYNRLTKSAGGLYELFQKEADPATLVYVMGTVEDDAHGPRSTFSPYVLRSFLGYAIKQVCCGGQHAAVLTLSGHIYTWGR